ncbi:glycoside hydrolase superfamily [Flammula alnicola]|nr:glycoside hydrolase superfamily [Flammula alnicola]
MGALHPLLIAFIGSLTILPTSCVVVRLSNPATALSTLQNHWNTWITESDFAAIAAAGCAQPRKTAYWILGFDVSAGEPYIQGQLPYLSKAVTWAQNHGLKVIVDLHGAPGSQNGFDNSGQRMGSPTWQTEQSFVDRTDAIIKTWHRCLRIIPAGYDGSHILSVTKQYWYDSYGNVRYPFGTSQQSNLALMIHDAFQSLSYWDNFMPAPNWQGVLLDTHIYQMFSVAWTPASNDCAKYLNGRGVGARYDGSYPGSTRVGSCTGLTGSASTFSSSYKTFLRQFWEAQVMSYEKGGQGWIQWTWKAENADEWTYQAGLANGWIPQNPTSFEFPNICS